jgi:hypothetical protein
MKYKLVSMPQVDVGELPLQLPVPDSINTGGYCIPSPRGSLYIYSPIDLLVAGLEAYEKGEIVTDLTQFFDKCRGYVHSMFDVTLAVSSVGEGGLPPAIRSKCIAEWIALIEIYQNYDLFKVMLRNAPLTFKWVIL